MKEMSNKKSRYTLGFVLLLALAVVIGGYSWMNREPARLVLPETMEGIIIQSPPNELPGFQMVDQDNRPITKENFVGKWSLLFFGYTHCPDVCPTTLGALNRLSLEPDLPSTQFVFASVDPARDTPAVLKEFVHYFNQQFIGMTGERAEIDKFRDTLGVIYDYEGDTNSADYIVNHVAALFIIDPKARLRAYILPPHDTKRIDEAYRMIRAYYEQ